MNKINKLMVLVFIFLMFSHNSLAEQDKQSRADIAVANILFDYDYGSEFASYRVDENGFVDLVMATNTPDEIYAEILTRMQNHPDIDDVLSSKSGPACKISNWKQ